jgi:hypothetical protein
MRTIISSAMVGGLWERVNVLGQYGLDNLMDVAGLG